MRHILRVGRFGYSNLFPIFHALESGCDCSLYEFAEGYPSELNRMLGEGLLDLSPSSSVLYLRDRERYAFIEGHSISSVGPVQSILLFSRVPIDGLGGREVFVTHQSETSPVLLGVILKKFYDISVALRTSQEHVGEAVARHSAYLAIGDEALLALHSARRINAVDAKADFGLFKIGRIGPEVFYVYDLGYLWHKHTGLPFVFALWTARKDSMLQKKELFGRFKLDLDRAKATALEDLGRAAEASPLRDAIGKDGLISYWKKISYGLDEAHIEGLELFAKYAQELRLLKDLP